MCFVKNKRAKDIRNDSFKADGLMNDNSLRTKGRRPRLLFILFPCHHTTPHTTYARGEKRKQKPSPQSSLYTTSTYILHLLPKKGKPIGTAPNPALLHLMSVCRLLPRLIALFALEGGGGCRNRLGIASGEGRACEPCSSLSLLTGNWSLGRLHNRCHGVCGLCLHYLRILPISYGDLVYFNLHCAKPPEHAQYRKENKRSTSSHIQPGVSNLVSGAK